MSLVTSCPACSTSFYVSPEQLSSHHGDVRCSQCEHVFNAHYRLSEVLVEDTNLEFQLDQSVKINTRQISSDSAILNIANIDTLESAKEEVKNFFDQSKPNIKDKSLLNGKLSMIVMSFLTVFLMLLALGQSFYYLRTPIATRWPLTKPYLVKACEFVACTVKLPRNINLLAIDDSDLEEDTEHPGLIHLSSTIINRAPFALEYPLFELSLTDADDKPILRRAFTASEYLPFGSDTSTGIATGEELHIKLNFTTNGLAVAGYRAFLRYP